MKKLLIILTLLVQISALAQVTNRFAFPALAGVRLREANITNGTNDSGNSALYGVAANYYDQDYYWNSAGPSGNEWTQWIVPQVLAAKAAGANCVRLMWDATAFIGDSTHHGAASWLGTNTFFGANGLTNQIGMLASLCQSNGIWLYPACSESRVLDVGNNPTNMVALYISNFCASAVQYKNVFAIDVVQEADGTANGTNSFVAKDCNLWIASAQAGMTAAGRTVPVTCSLNGASTANDLNLINRWQAYNLVAAGVNYLDVHAYYQYAVGDFYQAVTNIWHLPVVFGETGINISGVWGSGPDNESTHPYSSELRQDFFFTAQAVAEEPYFQLEGVWAIAPNWLTNEEDFGLCGGQQTSTYALTNSRDQLRNFALFPTNILPANYSWSVCCTGLNTSANNYNHYTRYAVGSGMLDITTNYYAPTQGIWQRQNNLVQSLGSSNTIALCQDCCQVLWQSALPNALGQTIQFDIPPQAFNSNTLYLTYANWECVGRGQANGNLYDVSLIKDISGTFDNSVKVQSYIGGVATTLTNVQYGAALNTNNWWRVIATFSTNISPTIITVSVSNMTSSTLMTPTVYVSDSTASLQAPGGMGLCAYTGTPNYTNINFTATFDNTPTVAAAPAGTPTGVSVALSWGAAAMGSGTINYTPQYNVSDPFGFPSTLTWTNGTQTAGLSQTLFGLPASTNLIFRVMSVDTTSATNYSPWQIVTTGAPASTPVTLYLPLRTF